MRLLGFILILASFAPAILPAQTILTWDPDGDVSADIGTGGGAWDDVTPRWRDTSVETPGMTFWLNTGTVRPVIVTHVGSYTISVDSGILTRGLAINATAWLSSDFTFSGTGSLTLTDPSVDVQNGNAIFNIPLISAVGLTLTSEGAYRTTQLNTANPGLLGVTTVDSGTLVFNHPGALGPETAGNGIEIGNGTLNFNYVSGGDFAYSLADPIEIWGTNSFYPHISIDFLTYSSRSATLSGPILLDVDAWFQGGPLHDYGSAQIISSGVISESSAGKNVLIVGDVVLSGANTFTGRLYLGDSYNDHGRATIPVFNDNGTAGPLGAGSGLVLGYNAGEGGAGGEIFYSGGTATSNRTIQIEGDFGLVGVINPASTLTLTGVISGSGSGSSHNFEKAGPGTLVLKAANTYTGNTDLTDGTLIVGNSTALGTSSDTVNVSTGNTSYDYNLSLLLENGVTLARNVSVYNYNSDGGSTTLGMSGSGTSTFSGNINLERSIEVKVDTNGVANFTGSFGNSSGSVTVTKSGDGRAVFSGGVTLLGGSFDINGGDLRLNGAVNVAQTIDVYSGGMLSGNATINQGVFVAGGGTLSPGADLGTMTMDSAYLSNSGPGVAIKWELGALTTTNTAQFDRIVFTGAGTNSEIYTTTHLDLDLSLLGVSQPTNANPLLNDLFWQTVQTWDVIDFTNGSGTVNLADGFLHPLLVSNATWAGGTFDTFVGGGAGDFAAFAAGDVYLRFTPSAVPEPATYALFLGLGSVLTLLPRLRRRHAACRTPECKSDF